MARPLPQRLGSELLPPAWRLSPRRLAFHVTVAIAVQTAVLFYLASRHWIDPILPWDDTAFVERAIYHLAQLRGSGQPRLWLHAPLGDLQTFLGLALFKLDIRGPYFLNFVYVAAATLTTSYYFRERALRTRVFATALVLSFMPLLAATAQLKSDQKGGLCLMIALLLLFEPRRVDLGGFWRIAAIAAALTMALAGKMTAVYLPVVIAGAIGIRAVVSWLEERGRPRGSGDGPSRSLRSYALLITTITVAYIALFVPIRHHLIGYIKFALSGKWDVEGASSWEFILFYTPFGGTGRYWAGHFAVAVLLAVLALRKGVRPGGTRVRLASLLVITGTLYAPLLADRNLNPDFGSYAYYAVLAVSLLLCRVVFDRESNGPPWPIALGIPAALLAVHDRPIFHWSDDRSPSQAQVAASEASLEQLSDAISLGGGNRVTFVFDTLLLPHPNLTFAHYKRHRRLLQVRRIDGFHDLPGALESSDFIVAVDDPDAGGLIKMKAWTNNQRIPEVVQRLDAAEGWALQREIPFYDFHLRLYARQ